MSFVETVEPLYMVKQMPEWLRFAGRHRRYACDLLRGNVIFGSGWKRTTISSRDVPCPWLQAMTIKRWIFWNEHLDQCFFLSKRYCLSLLYGSWCMIGWCRCNQRNWVPFSIVLVTLQAISFAEAFFTHSFDVLCCWDMGTGAGLLHILHIQSRT